MLLWCVGALFAILFQQGQADYEIFSMTFVIYFFPHVFELIIPILLIAFKIIPLDYKCILSTILLTIAIYTFVHFCNVIINDYCVNNQVVNASGNLISVNYMYSITPSIPILQFMWSVVPHSYWYMLVSIPLVALLLTLMYLPIIIKTKKKQK